MLINAMKVLLGRTLLTSTLDLREIFRIFKEQYIVLKNMIYNISFIILYIILMFIIDSS